MARICVFCASSERIDAAHVELGYEVGREIARRGHDLVWGGASVGTMGSVARGVRDGGRHTLGVIPEVMLPMEVADGDADELVVTVDMRDRKGRMDAAADGFLALPGGIGTLEELLEIWVGATIGIHRKPVVVLDPAGVYAPLHDLVERLTAQGFVRPEAARAVTWERDVGDALDALESGLGGPPLARPLPQPSEVVEEILEAEP
jgi:uncharacterized protein (TIGR00730 family)